MRSRLLAVALLGLAGALLAGTGQAAAAVPTLAVDPGYGPPLTIVKLSGRSFCHACGSVTISVASLDVDTASVGADGSFSKLIRIPGSARPGPVTIAASQGSTARTGRVTFTVTINQPAPTTYPAPASVPPPGNLPGGSTAPPTRGSATSGPSRSPSPSPSQKPSARTSAASPSPASPSSTTAAAGSTPAAGHGGGSGAVWPAALAGGVVLLAAGAGTIWYLRRRRA